ncbi:MAG TPA: hypothetical protein VMW47_05410 [Verrucomicrobiae bacterium]|nr:hypothetical protein [Verrucomicrobiae bacterium]
MSDGRITGSCDVGRAERMLRDWREAARMAAPRGLADATDTLRLETRVRLLRQSHAPGTPTPSVAPEPPAAISGHLARSVRALPVIEEGLSRFRSAVRTEGVVYAAIQQWGGTVRAHHLTASGKPGWLGWGGTPGHREHFARSVTLPPRPYLSTRERAVATMWRAVPRAIRDAWRR